MDSDEDCPLFCTEELELKPNQKKRTYNSYSNEDKISLLHMAEECGKKEAASKMNIPWSTAKKWLTRSNYEETLLSISKYI
jgi:hypothetical protein